MVDCFDAQCPDERGGPLEQRGALEPLEGALVGQRVRGLAIVGHRRADGDAEGPADLGPRIAPRAGGDDQELAATQLAHQAGQGGSEMDDPLERRMAQDDQDVAVCEHVADAAGEVREEPAGVDDHVGVEGAERLHDGGPGLLVGHRAGDAREAEEDGKAAGETLDVVPHGVGVERPPGRGEQRGQAEGGRRAETRSQVAAEGIRFDQEDPTPSGPARAERGGRGGHAGRTLERGEGDDGHFFPSLTSESPIWSAAA